jgi:hypothetical protein
MDPNCMACIVYMELLEHTISKYDVFKKYLLSIGGTRARPIVRLKMMAMIKLVFIMSNK